MTRRVFALYGAGTLTAAVAYLTAEVALWPIAAACVAVATVLYGLADWLRDQQHAREQAARPRGPNIPSWAACCPFWTTDAHTNDCTRSHA